MTGRARASEPLLDFCQARVENVCTGRAQVRHHLKGRLVPRGVTLDDPEHPDNQTKDLCDPCHRFVHAHPTWSYLNGWMLRRVS
jgi:hypothetical protein